MVLSSVSCLILYSFAVHGTFSYFSIFLNNWKLRTILRYLIISVITLNGHQFLPFLHISVVFYIYIFLYSFNFSTTLIFHIYLFVYLLVVLDIARALCMTQCGLLFFQRNTFVQLILFILFLISMTLIYIFISVVTIFFL